MFNILRTTLASTRLQTRNFSASARYADLAKLTLIGRLGKDPQVKSGANDKEYVVYAVATSNYPGPPREDGSRRDSGTSWHTILSFLPSSNNYLKTLQKGSLVYVEASYELREADPSAEPDSPTSKRQIFLRHDTIRLLSRPTSSEPKEGEQDAA